MRYLLLVFVLIAGLGIISPCSAGETYQFETYHNTKYGISFDYVKGGTVQVVPATKSKVKFDKEGNVLSWESESAGVKSEGTRDSYKANVNVGFEKKASSATDHANADSVAIMDKTSGFSIVFLAEGNVHRSEREMTGAMMYSPGANDGIKKKDVAVQHSGDVAIVYMPKLQKHVNLFTTKIYDVPLHVYKNDRLYSINITGGKEIPAEIADAVRKSVKFDMPQ